MRTFPLRLLVLGTVGLFLLGACSGPPTLQSHSLSQAPTVDGTISEWGGALTRVGKQSVSISAVPTDSVLYLAIVIPDRSVIRSVAENGLIVWVDPTDQQAHTYGVRYPLGLRAQRAQRAASGGSEEGPGQLALENLFPSDLAIIRNDTVRHRMPAGLSSALKVQATLNTGSLIYEMAVPVSPSGGAATGDARQHGLHTPLGRSLSVGLVTPDPDDESTLMPSSQGIPSVTGRGGRRRTPRGRQRGRQRNQPASPVRSRDESRLDLWTRVSLSGGS